MREQPRITNRFGAVAYEVMSDPQITMNEKAMYGYLASFTGKSKNYCWPCVKRMAAEFNVSTSTIKRLIKSLKQKEIIVRERRAGTSYVTILLK